MPEQVMLACITGRQTGQHSPSLSKASIRPLKWLDNASLPLFTRIHDRHSDPCLPLIKALDEEGKEREFFYTSGPGLTGGPIPNIKRLNMAVKVDNVPTSAKQPVARILVKNYKPGQLGTQDSKNDKEPDMNPKGRAGRKRQKQRSPVIGARKSKRLKGARADTEDAANYE